MARQAARLIACVLLTALAWAAGAQATGERPRQAQTAQTPWSALGPEERRILGPVADSWEGMPGAQQQRLISSARRYPSLQPIQKERFDTRIRDWATMAPEQRRAARETYQGLRKLPPERKIDSTAVENERLVHALDRGQQLARAVLDQQRDLRVGQKLAQRGQRGRGQDQVADSLQLDYQYFHAMRFPHFQSPAII